MALTPSAEFEQLLTTFERNSNTGSLKAANGTLVKLLRYMWSQIEVSPEAQAGVVAALAELSADTKALDERADALLVRAIETEPAHEAVAVALAEAVEQTKDENGSAPPITVEEGSAPSEDDAASAEESKPKRGGRPAKG